MESSATIDGQDRAINDASITFIEPDGIDDYVGEGEDFATIELGDAWDMNEGTDIRTIMNMSDVSVANGVLSARTNTSSYFYLLWQGYRTAQNLGKTGAAHPIDTDKYHRISVALCSNNNGAMYFYWFYDQDTSDFGVSNVVSVDEGCHVYVRDLRDLDGVNNKYWDGEIYGLRLDPKIGDGTIQIHWVRLTADPTLDDPYQISWENLSPSGSGQLDLFVDSDGDGVGGWQIATIDNPSSAGSYQWGAGETPLPVDMEAGSYSICAMMNGDFAGCSQDPIMISHAPQLTFINPSYTSGPDYATDAGNPWDMNGAGDIRKTRNVDNYYFADNMLYLESTSGDPQVTLSAPVPIDSTKYRFLSVRSHSDRQNNVDHGTVARLIWHPEAWDPNNIGTLGDIIIYPGWQVYSLDLSQAKLEPGSSLWEKQDWEVFRWDPNENTTGEMWYTFIDDIKLTGFPEGDSTFTIQWEIENPEDEAVDLDLYYDSDNFGFNGVHIGHVGSRSMSESAAFSRSMTTNGYTVYLPLVGRNMCSGDCLVWNTSQVAGKKYYIYGCLDDGVNQVCRYSDIPLIIKH